MPTKREGHIQKLLKRGKARVVSHLPFVVQLKYETENKTQPLYGGTDPGRTNVGNAVITKEGKVVYKDHLTTNNMDVPKHMAERKEHRQASRRGDLPESALQRNTTQLQHFQKVERFLAVKSRLC